MRFVVIARESSGRSAVVMAQQSAEESLTADGTDLRRRLGHGFLRRPRCGGGHCPVAEPLVRAMFVEEANVRLADVAEMAQAETQEVVRGDLAFLSAEIWYT